MAKTEAKQSNAKQGDGDEQEWWTE